MVDDGEVEEAHEARGARGGRERDPTRGIHGEGVDAVHTGPPIETGELLLQPLRAVHAGSPRMRACSFRIASISASGRGGQPGTYMSTGTMRSTPCTMA